jgi:hypothetical protein
MTTKEGVTASITSDELFIVVVDVNGKEALNFCAHWSPEKGFLYGRC